MTHTLSEPARLEQEIRKSRFLAQAERCGSEQEARDFLQRVGDPGATHNCWAWRSGQSYRFDDDGEPSGTAGRPILAAIENQGLDQVAVVVTRYYGGIKLGTGGLARAYGGTAAECLRTAATEALVTMQRLTIHLPFDQIAIAHQLLERHGAEKLSEAYDGSGVELTLQCPESVVTQLQDELRDASSGQARFRSD
jgi:uncharacterized YigZ family protein